LNEIIADANGRFIVERSAIKKARIMKQDFYIK
jgi:hypothetical protein